MPIPTPCYDGNVSIRVESCRNPSLSLSGDVALNRLPLAIVLIESESEAICLGVIIGEKKLKRLICRPEATGGIDAGADCKAEVDPVFAAMTARLLKIPFSS